MKKDYKNFTYNYLLGVYFNISWSMREITELTSMFQH